MLFSSLIVYVLPFLGGIEAKNVLIIYAFMHAVLFYGFGFRTPGQLILKIETLEGSDREAPSMTARGIRLALTLMSLMPLSYFFEQTHNKTAFYIIIIFLNFGLITMRQKLLQDYSATRLYLRKHKQ